MIKSGTKYFNLWYKTSLSHIRKLILESIALYEGKDPISNCLSAFFSSLERSLAEIDHKRS